MILSGMNAPEQVVENMTIFDSLTPLKKEEIKLLEKAQDILNAKAPNTCTYCGDCQKARPRNIAISAYIGLYNNRNMFTADGWQDVQYNAIAAQCGKAGACKGCTKCETVCPQNIKISGLMKDVARAFE